MLAVAMLALSGRPWVQARPQLRAHATTNFAYKVRYQPLRLERIGWSRRILNLGKLFSANCTVHDRPPCNGFVLSLVTTLGDVAAAVSSGRLWRSSPMNIIGAAALSGFLRKTAESTSDFASVVHSLIMDVRDSYRPGLHYTRGPGPQWRAKNKPWLTIDSQPVSPARQHQRSPLHARHREQATPDSQVDVTGSSS